MNRSVYIKIDYAVGSCNTLNVQTKSGLQINSNERGVNVVFNYTYSNIFRLNATYAVAVSFEILLKGVLINSQVLN